MSRILLGLGLLGAGAYTATTGGVFQGDQEENNEVITGGQFPGQGQGVGGSPITSGQAPGPSVNIEAPDVQPMDLEGLESGFSSKKEKESSSSSSSTSSSSSGSSRISLANEAKSEIEDDRQASVKGGGFSTPDGAGYATAPDNEGNQETMKKEKETQNIPASGPGDQFENNIETSKKEETSSESSGIFDRARNTIGGIF